MAGGEGVESFLEEDNMKVLNCMPGVEEKVPDKSRIQCMTGGEDVRK